MLKTIQLLLQLLWKSSKNLISVKAACLAEALKVEILERTGSLNLFRNTCSRLILHEKQQYFSYGLHDCSSFMQP